MDILMNVLKDKKELIKFLLETIQSSQKEKEGLLKLSESLTRSEPNLKIENIAKCLSTTMQISAKQSHTIQSLAVIALIQCQSSDFDVSVAQMLNKMGRGDEALKQMIKNKFGDLTK